MDDTQKKIYIRVEKISLPDGQETTTVNCDWSGAFSDTMEVVLVLQKAIVAVNNHIRVEAQRAAGITPPDWLKK
jgi:hypothetical protein